MELGKENNLKYCSHGLIKAKGGGADTASNVTFNWINHVQHYILVMFEQFQVFNLKLFISVAFCSELWSSVRYRSLLKKKVPGTTLFYWPYI